MIEVPMGVDREIDRAAAYRRDRGLHFAVELRELVVDDHYTVRSDGYADVAARAKQHVQAISDFFGADLDGIEVPLKGLEQLVEVHYVIVRKARKRAR